MESKILVNEIIENTERKFGSWRSYYPCIIIFGNGQKVNALFTRNQILTAVKRAVKNPEDIKMTKYLKEILD